MIFVIRNQSAPINISYESKLGSLFYNFRDFISSFNILFAL